MIVETSGWRHLKEKNKLFLSCEYPKMYHPGPKTAQLSKIAANRKWKNLFLPFVSKSRINTPLKIRRTGIRTSMKMLRKLIFNSLSAKVTLKYVVSGSVIQRLSRKCQPMTPYLFFRLISYYCIFDKSSKWTGGNNLFVNGFRRFVGLLINSNASSLLGSYLTTREWQFLPHSYGKK